MLSIVEHSGPKNPVARNMRAKDCIVLNPDKPETADAALVAQHFATGQALLIAVGATRLVPVLQDKRWGVGWYQDGIHPTAAGFKTLAAIMPGELTASMAGSKTSVGPRQLSA